MFHWAIQDYSHYFLTSVASPISSHVRHFLRLTILDSEHLFYERACPSGLHVYQRSREALFWRTYRTFDQAILAQLEGTKLSQLLLCIIWLETPRTLSFFARQKSHLMKCKLRLFSRTGASGSGPLNSAGLSVSWPSGSLDDIINVSIDWGKEYVLRLVYFRASSVF